ncbi:MAG: hypothetical protein C0605_03050 [Hyphomicrobiales bacterium]|nr:MAG: hypothetical protein C0605_03050 [Hyphomicrobiales bacterium]
MFDPYGGDDFDRGDDYSPGDPDSVNGPDGPGGDIKPIIIDLDGDRTLRTSHSVLISADGQHRVANDDLDGDGNFDVIRTTDVTVLGDGSTVSTDALTNQDGTLRSSATISNTKAHAPNPGQWMKMKRAPREAPALPGL